MPVSKELRRWYCKPFCSPAPENRLRSSFEAKTCAHCGSILIVGGDALIQSRKYENHFCDIECTNEYKKWHNRTPQYQNKINKQSVEQLADSKRKRASIRYQRIRTENRRNRKICCCIGCGKLTKPQVRLCLRCSSHTDSGNVTCLYCGKVKWFDTRCSRRKFCKESHGRKHGEQNRKHLKRTNGEYDEIGLLRLAKRDRFLCWLCGVRCVEPTGMNKPDEATCDHVIPLSKGGTHTWGNVKLACRNCNSRKSDTIVATTAHMGGSLRIATRQHCDLAFRVSDASLAHGISGGGCGSN